jgi:hypothetical protein
MEPPTHTEEDGLAVAEAQIRECYGRVVYSHKSQGKCADQRLTEQHRLKLAQIVLSAITTAGLIAVVFGNPSVSRVSAIGSAALSAALFVINTYTKDTDYGVLARQHKDAANKLWNVRESYLSLLADIRSGCITYDSAISRRDTLQAELASVYAEAPPTTGKAYQDARKGLRSEEEMTFSDQEIDAFLPKQMRKEV